MRMRIVSEDGGQVTEDREWVPKMWEGLYAPTLRTRRGVKPLPHNLLDRGEDGGAGGGFVERQRLVAFRFAGIILRHRELGAEFLEGDQLEPVAVVFDDRGERL